MDSFRGWKREERAARNVQGMMRVSAKFRADLPMVVLALVAL